MTSGDKLTKILLSASASLVQPAEKAEETGAHSAIQGAGVTLSPRQAQAPIPMDRISEQEFRKTIRDKGWRIRELAQRWDISESYLSRISGKAMRAQHWNDAIRGLPYRNLNFTASNAAQGMLSTLEQVQASAAPRPVRFHVFDIQGDLTFNAASSITFGIDQEQGINPFMQGEHTRTFATKRIDTFINALKALSRLGSQQEDVLRKLLADLADAPSPSTSLSIAQAISFGESLLIMEKQKAALNALESFKSALSDLSSETGKTSQWQDTLKAIAQNETRLRDGFQPQLLDHYPLPVLQRVIELLKELHQTGLFSTHQPAFDAKANIWRYDISRIAAKDQKAFSLFQAGAIADGIASPQQQDHSHLNVILIGSSWIFICDGTQDVIPLVEHFWK